MGWNFTQQASTSAARSVTTLMSTAERFDYITGIHPESTAHTKKSDTDDVITVVKVVQSCKILIAIDGREHTSFGYFSASPLSRLKRQDLEQWILQRAKDHDILYLAADDNEQNDSDTD